MASSASNTFRYKRVCGEVARPTPSTVGFEVAAQDPARIIISLTVLNSPVEVTTFRRPLVMKPFAVKGLGELYRE